MELVVSALVALFVVGFIGYPLLKEQTSLDEPQSALSEEAEELYWRKESTYSALKELEFDFKTGKLSESDYRELEERYRAEAIEVLEAIDRLEKEGTTRGDKAAKKAAAIAASMPPLPGVEAEDEVVGPAARRGRKRSSRAGGSGVSSAECAECGSTRNPAGAKFCGACGASLAAPVDLGSPNGDGAAEGGPEPPVCDDCGADLGAGHRFCGACGAEVRS